MNRLATLTRLVVLIWALALALLVPFFFFNFGGQWLRRVADLWPLSHP